MLSRINAQLIERHFAVSADTATAFMARLVEEGHFDEIGVDGWHYPLLRGERLRRSRATRKLTEKPKVNEVTVEQPIAAANLNKRIQELEREGRALQARVKRLQNAGKTVITQREEWKTRALAAEDRLETERRRPINPDKRFDALRRLIAKELHPDFSSVATSTNCCAPSASRSYGRRSSGSPGRDSGRPEGSRHQ